MNLDTQACCLFETLPSEYMNFDGRSCVAESDFDDMISLRAIYHLCRILPHLSMLRFLQKQEPWAQVHIQPCSKIAVRHINQISDIVRNCISAQHSFRSALSPFVACCSLLSSSVYFKYVKGLQNRHKCSANRHTHAFRLLETRLLSHLALRNNSRAFGLP